MPQIVPECEKVIVFPKEITEVDPNALKGFVNYKKLISKIGKYLEPLSIPNLHLQQLPEENHEKVKEIFSKLKVKDYSNYEQLSPDEIIDVG